MLRYCSFIAVSAIADGRPIGKWCGHDLENPGTGPSETDGSLVASRGARGQNCSSVCCRKSCSHVSSVLACHVKLHLHLIRDLADLKESIIIDTEWLAANGY